MNTPSNKILYFADSNTRGRGATLLLQSGEPCLLSIAQPSVRVRKSRFGFFGATLYEEKVVYKASLTAIALSYLFPNKLFPTEISDLNLRGFLNGIMHCGNAAEVSAVLNEAIVKAENQLGRPINNITQDELPAWAYPPQ